MLFKNFFGKFRVGYRFLEDLLYNKDNSMKERMESMATEPLYIKIKENDNVAITVHAIPAGTEIMEGVVSRQEIPQGHKMALFPMKEQDQIVKYGFSIGHATTDIAAGDWVHTHNMATNLSGEIEYKYEPQVNDLKEMPPQTFQGYRRGDGKAGIRRDGGKEQPAFPCVHPSTDGGILLPDVEHLVFPQGIAQLGKAVGVKAV